MSQLDYIFIGLGIFSILFLFLFIKEKKRNNKILSNVDEEYKQKIQQKEDEIQQKIKQKEEEYSELNKKLEKDYSLRLVEINNKLQDKIKEINLLSEKQLALMKNDIELKKEAEEKALKLEIELKKKEEDLKLKKELDTAREWFNQEVERLRESKEKYEQETNEAALEYVETLEVLEDFRARREVVNSQILREKNMRESTDFYRICLTDDEIDDLAIIKEIEHRFNNKEVLHRAAYDCYIKRPLQEMLKRVLKGEKPSGIYCITYFPTGEMYIGRSTDIANRWQEHCKSAYGIGTIAHSSLHTKMARDGIQNFCFQVLEICPKEKLNEREKYWIEMYGSTNLLNQKAGG